jgi:hypothetical protein
MTILDDQRPTASGTTSLPGPPPQLPNVDAARQFYLYGAGAMTTGGWVLQYNSPALAYVYLPESSRRAALLEWVVQEFTRLRKLPLGWDGHRAKPITQEAIYGAAWVLNAILDGDSQQPQIFPLPDGGVQVEWYADGDDIEVEIDRIGEAHVLAESARGETLAEGTFDPQSPSEMISVIAKLVKEFSARVSAAQRRGGHG